MQLMQLDRENNRPQQLSENAKLFNEILEKLVNSLEKKMRSLTFISSY